MGYKSKFKGAEIDARLEKMVNVTYAELKALRDEGKLIAGQMYRMTDYETTCTWENTQVAGHPFDLVLTALDNKTLDEKCSAIQSARDKDGYFANSNLAAWEVRYCLDNDAERFVWMNADWEYVTWVDANGKGVIYRLVDEAENDVPYDFKNIMFSRPLTKGKYDAENGVDTFCYTFSCIDEDTYAIEDHSVKEPDYCYNNKLGDRCYDNVFISYDCRCNTLGNDCCHNTFQNCMSNVLGDGCAFIYFSESTNNTVGNHCYDITFIDTGYDNVLGDGCSNITLGEYCESNTFGNYCEGITLKSYDEYGGYCSYNTFGNKCNSINLVDYCQYLVFGDGCSEITLLNDKTASDENMVQYYEFNCVSGRIQVDRGSMFQTFVTVAGPSGRVVSYHVGDFIDSNPPM
jgi:hypothetical protein